MGSDATQPRKRLGDWLARANNTVYQAATDGDVLAITSVGNVEIIVYTDGSNPPTTARDGNYSYGGTVIAGASTKVRKDDYWETVGATTVFWIPLEP